MTRWLPTILCGLMVVPWPASGQSLDRAVLEQLKDASVYIRVSQSGKVHSAGSGFVIRVDGDTALVLTNHHVAVPDASESPRGGNFEVSVVFRSGSPTEQELPATLLGSIFNETTDLALLEVKGVKQPPRPIPAEQTAVESEFFETMPVTALGFPLGEMIQGVVGRTGGNPAITVTPMTIGSLRRDAANQLLRVQLNGSLIQGNSGGPIVDAKGRLVGVAVSRLRGEAVGFAIPPRVIAQFLNGTLDLRSLNVVSVAADGVELKVEARLVDPFNRVKSVTLRRAAASMPIPPATRPGEPALVNDPAPVSLALADGMASGQFKVALGAAGERKVTFQVVMTDKSGRMSVSSPVTLDVPSKPGLVTRIGGEGREKTEARWSCDVNVEDGCTIHHEGGETTIDVPGGSPFINAPQSLLHTFNAPASVVQVKGNFFASVVVDCDLDPGAETISGTGGKKLPFTFQGAGLLIWQDENNFVRIERCKGSQGGVGLIHRALVEVYSKGREVGVHYSQSIPDVPTVLAVRRKGASIQVLYSRAPNELVVFQELAVDFRDEVLVGVAASNLSKRPLKARFREVHLTDLERQPLDVTKIDRKRLVVPKFDTLGDGTLVFEGTALKVVKDDVGTATPDENMARFSGEWSKGQQLFWRGKKKGDFLSVEFNLEQQGKFDPKVMLTKGPEYGRVIVSLDGKPVNSDKPWNLYAPEVKLGNAGPLGTGLLLAKGMHKLTFTIAGKDDQSTGFAVGLDDVRLVPTAKAAPKADPKKADEKKPGAKPPGS
jgi:S1-C subfamily serine protease